MYTCIHCKRQVASKKSNWIHQSRCLANPNRFKQTPWNKGKTGKQIAWNKGATGLPGTPHSDETKMKLSNLAKQRGLGGYVRGSGRGRKGWYQGFFCDSSWELAFVIYCLDNEIPISRNIERRQYHWDGMVKTYIPDFVVNDVLIEIKGFRTPQWEAKQKANPDVIAFYEEDLVDVFNYVHQKYGKDYTRLYEESRVSGTQSVLKTDPS